MAEKASVDGGAGKLTQLPVARIKTIMKSSPDLPSFSQDSVFLITKATELFVDYLAVTAHKQESDSRQLTYKGLYIVPPKVLVKDFMESLKKSRKSSIEIRSSSSDSESE
ncbi:chromatin accessibility complex protein 1-like isoform X2 [Orbicella faveolata]|uniref:chromatin accessibility complex protein 1-like isoform X2 n=1 Tax=Orbicella faveolata TaxID=48498 RepID=UPI0009E28680|nr:chromatin accessibility complex protein 1-like isoform X2 [Orbicella faveolata]